MKKRSYVLLWAWLMIPVMLLGVLVAGANAQEPKYGGTLRYLDRAPSLNPLAWDIADWVWKHAGDTGFYMEHLIMGDLQKGPGGTKQFSFQVGDSLPPEIQRGELLQSWEVKKNPPRIIFHLRKGVFWQEKPGIMKAREFTADDVVYSMTRLKSARKAIPLYLDFIDRWEIVDKHTLILHMKEWCADWDYRMAWGYYDAIQAPEQEKAPGGPGKWQNACGTGPYMITDYKEGHSETFTRNPNYWDSETIKGKKYKLPFTDRIVMMIIKDESTQITALRTGKIDLAMAVNWKYMADLKKTNPQLQWSRRIFTDNFTMAMRMDTKPFDDIRVRRALNMAINQKEIVDSFYGGNAEIAQYPFPKTLGAVHTPLEKLPPSARELFTYNPEKAKKLLAEAGYPDGFTFKAQVSNANPAQLDLASMVVAYLAKIGVKCELEPLDYPSWLSRLTKKTHAPGFFFSTSQGNLFSGTRKNFMSGQTWNPSMMKDPYVDKLWETTVENQKLTAKQATEEMRKLAVYALDQAPGIILPVPYHYVVWWPWVKNYHGEVNVGAFRSAPILARVWIDQELKKSMGFE
ncbi:MAG: ABC transporter substrate-binding protein [Deltaproteobacteria bacterium]|nr:ABC transporter substrate-binding protein [Deltaproteobacteria bacterium]